MKSLLPFPFPEVWSWFSFFCGWASSGVAVMAACWLLMRRCNCELCRPHALGKETP